MEEVVEKKAERISYILVEYALLQFKKLSKQKH